MVAGEAGDGKRVRYNRRMTRTLRPDGSAEVGPFCPKCGSAEVVERKGEGGVIEYHCKHCGHSEPKEGHDWSRDAPEEGGQG